MNSKLSYKSSSTNTARQQKIRKMLMLWLRMKMILRVSSMKTQKTNNKKPRQRCSKKIKRLRSKK